MWVSACTVIVMIIIWLRRQGYLEFVTESTIHDMGKWMFAISFMDILIFFSIYAVLVLRYSRRSKIFCRPLERLQIINVVCSTN